MDGIAHAAGLLALSFVFRLALIKLESALGLTRKAWAISLSGIFTVPALLIGLVMLVLQIRSEKLRGESFVYDRRGQGAVQKPLATPECPLIGRLGFG